MKLITALVAVLALSLPFASLARAHCEVPCGIYDDEARLNLIAEHITTIERSMRQIQELSQQEPRNYNQIVRWINNKEHHANELQHIVSQYFMTQRIKPADEKDEAACERYMKQLKLAHRMLVYAMKAKQTTDPANVDELRALLASFRDAYLGEFKH